MSPLRRPAVEAGVVRSRQDVLADVKEYVLRLLGRKDYTEKQLQAKLARKGYTRPSAAEAIRYFKERNLINDEKFAFRYSEARLDSRPCGPRLLEFELARKGIEKKLIKQVVGKMFEAKPETEFAREAVRRKFGRKAEREKVYRFLLRRGFSFDVITGTLNRARITNE
ncbi:hypothetical protein COY52_05345 [Candidatus Desantisbacteria bacterium CG_4_10_14_0_8_um_filter_48_22]|uniref:Regulatory protein RecX n=1 Tax=Candidatus Desantisbacteria bacterium CG_4_10_14_0_8_um_filter_48_22 TaxID=1974543 RepID=A0A2M7SC91_9BACT|nr:MAG: hypothetical protein COS16_05640 [Candidatus Desantisbacteria bacterium CG02_land_8_20_14_3_00_49_13]PIZ17089.1 MAG: hypothetical protein COY52_05345 [Candidatus Desantisbacteria bacterium CG_4_10_14_0_8_um_filter_48_22]